MALFFIIFTPANPDEIGGAIIGYGISFGHRRSQGGILKNNTLAIANTLPLLLLMIEIGH
ncbi:hypothetical protein NIES4074_11820 [Cylindrospermum sp. NIES-4074]|jgi:hypothetical protein|nr:hypothetical protein NIES4074_11820 [Cylindrospermum sp. NIES-4074]